MYDFTVTLFNKTERKQEIVDGDKKRYEKNTYWQATVLDGVEWQEKIVLFNDAVGINEKLQISCFIPAAIEGYISPADYDEKPVDELKDFWTARTGDKLILGEVAASDLESIDISAIEKKYKCITIKTIGDNKHFDGIGHWHITGE